MAAGVPLPPSHFYPPANAMPNAEYRGGGQPQIQILDPNVEHALTDVAKEAKDTKAKKSKKDAEQYPFVQTNYEAYSLQRMTPNVGDAKTWSKVGKLKSPFDSAKIYKDAIAHRKKTGLDPAKVYDRLLINQQGVIDRMLIQKRQEEKNPNAIWTLFDVRKVREPVRKGIFRADLETVKLVVTLRCQDKSRSTLNDKPPGSTASPGKFVGEIIDLSVPPKEGKKKKNKGDKPASPEPGDAAGADVLDGLQNEHPQGQPAYQGAADPWHGYGNDPYYNQAQNYNGQYPQTGANYDTWAQAQQGYNNNNYAVPPAAPMAPYHDNPFTPNVGHPEQYGPFYPPNDTRAYNDYSARSYSRSRSRNPSRYHSRHRSISQRRRHHHTPSVGSSLDDDGFWSPTYTSADTQFTPPPSPDIDDARLRRRGSHKRQTYHREGRTAYPDEQYVMVPVATRHDGQPLTYRPRRQRPGVAVLQDDYPGSRRQRAITDYAEGFEDADFTRRGRRGEGADFRRDPVRGSGYHDGYRPSGARRYSSMY